MPPGRVGGDIPQQHGPAGERGDSQRRALAAFSRAGDDRERRDGAVVCDADLDLARLALAYVDRAARVAGDDASIMIGEGEGLDRRARRPAVSRDPAGQRLDGDATRGGPVAAVVAQLLERRDGQDRRDLDALPGSGDDPRVEALGGASLAGSQVALEAGRARVIEVGPRARTLVAQRLLALRRAQREHQRGDDAGDDQRDRDADEVARGVAAQGPQHRVHVLKALLRVGP